MKKSLLILVFQLACVTVIYAQNYKFGKVSKEELEEKVNPLDTTASATILYHEEKVRYAYNPEKGFEKIINVQRRIKIYDKKGFEWAKHSVNLYDENVSTRESLTDLKAITYNLEGGKIVSSKMRKSGVFEEKKNKYWMKKSFTLPNVKSGSVIEYVYEIKSPLASSLDDVSLQEEIPIKMIKLQLDIPEYFVFQIHYNPQSNIKPKLEQTSQYKEKNLKWTDQLPDAYGRKVTHERTIEYKEERYKFSNTNVPALKREKFVSNLGHYKSKLSFELAYTKNFDKKTKSYATNWDAVTKTIYDSESFGGELKKDSHYKDDIDNLLQSISGDDEKISALYNYVKSKIKWDDFLGVYPNKGVRKAYKEGAGNVAEINLTLVSMLRYAGLNANPILVSTKSNGIPLYPTRQGFNYVICGVEMNERVLLLDATEKYATLNILPERALNWQGRIIREHGSSAWVSLYPKENSISTTMVAAKMGEDFTFNGKLRTQSTNYLAYGYRDSYEGVVKEDMIKELSEGKGEIEIMDLKVDNEKNLNKPVMQQYSFNYEDGAEEIGNEIYITPLLFFTETDNIFNQEKRSYPIDFRFPRAHKTIINMSLPEGYKIKSLPESIKMSMEDNLGEYSFLVKESNNNIQISQTFKVNFPLIPASYYQDLKAVYKNLIEKNSEKIVLEKI